MARCEANYYRLLRLFPCLHDERQRRLALSLGNHPEVVLSVLERTTYTTLLTIEQRSPESMSSWSGMTDKSVTVRWFNPPVLTVRLYHDAQMAEVITCNSNRGVQPNNAYPNRHMFQPDEKRQWNGFLEEWLVLCQRYGYVVDAATPSLDTAE